MNSYEQKIEDKRDRMRARADRLNAESQRRLNTAKTTADAIPFGQPILVGHHSEKRHRRDLKRINDNYDKGFAMQKEAAQLETRAAHLGEYAISSDDPDAVTKLRQKVEALERTQERMKAANKFVRAGDRVGLEGMGFSQHEITGLFTPDFAGRRGYANFELTNNNANIRRIRQRIAELEEAAARVTVERAPVAGLRIVENAEANRVQIFFDGKPAEAIRDKLKSFAFRWAPSEGAWQRHLGGNGTYYAEQFAKWYAEQQTPAALPPTA